MIVLLLGLLYCFVYIVEGMYRRHISVQEREMGGVIVDPRQAVGTVGQVLNRVQKSAAKAVKVAKKDQTDGHYFWGVTW